jgi:type II secretory pathway pseudopilin PulG
MNRRRHRTGFTLIELAIALTAGLIVAMGIVALSREATRTFHEEVRSAAAEATLRTAIDRLRADIQRAGFMSTANIVADPLLVGKPATNVNPPGISDCTTYSTICNLAAVHVANGGSALNTPLSGVQTPALAPDSIDIGGNMTSVEQFEVQAVLPIANGAQCQMILLSRSSAAYARIVGGVYQANTTDIAHDLQYIFAPDSASQFIVRVVDDTGRSQFLATCPGSSTASNAAGFLNGVPFVQVDSRTPVQTAKNTGNVGGVSGFGSGRAWVNPVQVVRWEIVPVSLESPVFQSPLGTQAFGGTDPAKYDLVRSFLGMDGTTILSTQEVVAEYAVDLDFAFSFESGTPIQPVTATFPFDDKVHKQNDVEWGGQLAQATGAIPQRLRSVRVRLATRVAQPDRAVNIPSNAGSFLYRYCVNAGGCANLTDPNFPQWARMRTITADVSLPNLATDFYP